MTLLPPTLTSHYYWLKNFRSFQLDKECFILPEAPDDILIAASCLKSNFQTVKPSSKAQTIFFQTSPQKPQAYSVAAINNQQTALSKPNNILQNQAITNATTEQKNNEQNSISTDAIPFKRPMHSAYPVKKARFNSKAAAPQVQTPQQKLG